MSSDNFKFFPTRDEREVFDWVINDFPFPLALTYARLQDELDKQSPIAAAWQLRDAFESLLKFTTCVAIADFLRANPDPEDASAVIGLLFKRGGLSLGDWVTLLIGQDDRIDKGALRPLEAFARSESLDQSGRLLPELFNLFFKLKGKEGKQFSDLSRRLKGDGGSTDPNKYGFVEWRNRVFGHGTFKSNYGFYAEETNRWLSVLHEFLQALRPVFAGWSLISVASDGSRTTWQGEKDLPYVESHTHEPEGEPLLMQYAHRSSSRVLPFGLLMSLQRCTHCKQPTAFFYDRNRYDRKKDRHRTYFLEYFGGHEESYQNWLETQKLAAKLPPHFDWQRASYDSQEVQGSLALLFRDFDKELVRPDYLADNFWRIVEEQSKGYVHLIGESGMGKTFFVRALAGEGKERGKPVLAYHILSGALSDYRTFISELSDRARETLRFRTQEAQTNVAAITDLQEQFAEYLAQLMSANGLDQLVLAIDALDELPEPEAGAVAITSLLPAPERLPAGCFVLLTSREALHPGVRQDLERLEQQDAKTKATGQPERFTKIRIRPEDAENQRLLRAYLQEHLPQNFCDRESIETVLQRCGSVFLYAFHFCRALESGAFANVQTLPEGRDFYPTYLASLREATGRLYDSVYLKALLLLAAAQTPVTINQLVGWGIPKKDLPFDLPVALLGIKDFLRLHRVRMWHDSLSEDEGDNRYDIAHEAFVRYLREDAPMAERLREAHANIARLALAAHQGKWKELEAKDDAQLYNLRFVLIHLREAGLRAEEAALRNDEEYASQCSKVAYAAHQQAKHFIAANLNDNAISAYRYLIEQGRSELANKLAGVLMNKGLAIANLGKLVEAIGIYDEAISIYLQSVNAGRHELLDDLATAMMNKGNTLADMGKLEEAIGVYDVVIAIHQQLINLGRNELANSLAGVLINKGNAIATLGNQKEAIGSYDEAINIYRQLINAGRNELANDLATVLTNKATAFLILGKLEEAISIYDEAISIYRQLVNAGRGELANNLADVLINKGNAVTNMGKLEEAITIYDEAVK
ncbi:MAG: tetratricopeptide repeat protein, partial [Pyrinomonadaceae bacterium]